MRRQVPLLLVFVAGWAMVIQYFIPHETSEFVLEYTSDWIIVIGVFAMALGIWSLIKVNYSKVKSKAPGWGYNIIVLLGLAYMIISGAIGGIAEGGWFMKVFWWVYTPIQATMFSLLAFYIASAAYRAFRARSVIATILLATAIIVMLRLIPIGPLSSANQKIATWILMVPNMAGNRAILMGVGLGIVATAMKIILGIERAYMGRD